MEIRPGDRFIIVMDGIDIPVQAVSSKDGGKTWHCCRTDRSLAESSLLLSAAELLESLKTQGSGSDEEEAAE